MAPELRVFNSGDEVCKALLKRWREAAAAAVAERGAFSAALSGGETPRGFYLSLSREKRLPWDRTVCFQVDERFLPAGHKENNGRMISSALLGEEVPERVLRLIHTNSPTAAEAAEDYEEELRKHFSATFGSPPTFDFILLGMGKDGHTASLFPGNGDLTADRCWVKAVTPVAAPHLRITLTLPVLNAAREVIFLVLGAGKAEALRAVLSGPAVERPASLVSPRKGRLSFFADPEAASCLEASPGGPEA